MLIGLCFSSDYIIFIDGDTIINGIKYFKTYKFGTETVTSIITGTIISIDTFQNQLNPIREENKRFYKFDANSNQDVQIQRFDLETGDTLNPQANTPLIVGQIDTFLYFQICFESRKKDSERSSLNRNGEL